MSPLPPPLPDRVTLLERLQEQQSAINDITRQALATLNETLRTQQRTLETEQRTLERHSHALDLLLQRIEQHADVVARLDATLQAIKDLLGRPPNGH